MQPEFKQLLQIGMIVRDVDKAVRYYEDVLGMGPWTVSFMRGDEPPMEDLTVDGKPMPCIVSKLAFLNAYGIELELIEPIADTPFKQWLEEHGPGIHHIAAVTQTPYDELLRSYRRSTGKDIWIRGQGLQGLMDYSFLDLREETGLIVECYKNVHPDRPRTDF
ncbi:MAG: VOC family protein [Oscillospiraceae bacterium]|nr:VOC family protein [uncultured Oscillibacter sp.]MDE6923509.1 VOC family protein [Oscillospiraceae bacterium]